MMHGFKGLGPVRGMGAMGVAGAMGAMEVVEHTCRLLCAMR